jgi:hypothetical protein
MATGYPQQAARVEAGEKQSGQPRLCTYVMREQGVAINHQKRGIQAESIAVNVFPDGENIVRFSSQIFPCDYGFHKKFQVFSLRIVKPGDSLGGIVMQRTSLTQGITRT